MLSAKETVDFWADKFGLGKKGKDKKKRLLREAKKKQRQSEYVESKGVGYKAVENQLRKKRQMDRIVKGND